jgi:hypothetical protein
MMTIAERWVASDQPVIIERRALAGPGSSQALANYRSVNNMATEPGLSILITDWSSIFLSSP